MAVISIVGAGRSGTNLLAGTFEHESPVFRNLHENRYIWSYGQRCNSFDNRGSKDATPKVVAYIRRHFERQMRSPDDVLIDKTPSNALRIPFMAAIMPDIKIINIIRGGRDNIVSRTRQWEGQRKGEDPSVSTAASAGGKLRILKDRLAHVRRLVERGNIPLDRVPAMLADNVPAMAIHLATGRPRRYAERVAGLPHILASQGLDAAAAVQWRETVMTAHIDGRRLGPARYLEVRFEELVADSQRTWSRIMEFVEVSESGAGASYLAKTIRPHVANAPSDGAERERIRALEAHLRPTLEYLGYAWDSDAPDCLAAHAGASAQRESIR